MVFLIHSPDPESKKYLSWHKTQLVPKLLAKRHFLISGTHRPASVEVNFFLQETQAGKYLW